MNKIAILSTAALIFLAACQRHDHQNDETANSTTTASTTSASEGDTLKAGTQLKDSTYTDPHGKVITIHRINPKGVSTMQTYEITSDSKPFLIKGKLINGAGGNIILDKMGIGKYEPQYTQTVDNNENYKFIGEVSEPELYQLRLPAGAIHLIVYPGDTISVQSKLDDWVNYKVKGSPASLQLLEMYQILERSNDKKDAVEDRLKKAHGLEQSRLQAQEAAQYAAIEKVKHNDLRALIKRVDTSLVALMAALYLDPAEDLPLLKELDKKFANRYPASTFYQAVHEKVVIFAPSAVGMYAPEMITQRPEGGTVHLSDFKGKVLLLNFWASYSPKSIQENEELSKLYQKYKSKNFEILSYSLDKKKDDWLNAIKAKKSPGVQVSDLLGFESGAVSAYTITNVPMTVLINKDGRIVARNLTIPELDKMLARLTH